MEKFVLKLAGIAIEIHYRYAFVKELCKEYEETEPVEPAFTVQVTEAEIETERQSTGYRFSKEICESTCVHRAVVNGLVPYGIFLMHSAVIAVDGRAYVFLAKSGVGKSTHLRMWKEQFGKRAVIVNGDKPMFSFEGDKLMVHGSPWRGKEQWGINTTMPVQALCILERGENNTLTKAAQKDMIGRIFHQVLLPKKEPELSQFLNMMNRVIQEIPCYRLQCTISVEAAAVAYEGMCERKEKDED